MCPLSHQLMTDPVWSIHGETFQREAILAWLDMENDYCPFSGRPLNLSDIIPNYALRIRIQMWIEDNDLFGDDSERVSLDVDEESEHLRKIGISSKGIEIDTGAFKRTTSAENERPTVKEVHMSSYSIKKSFSKIPSISKKLFKLGAYAA
jgi:U-box domain